MSAFAAGVDGGGTKTTVVCCFEDGRSESRTFGPFNLNGIGEDSFRKLLLEIRNYLESLGECRALCFGASGVDNSLMSVLVNEVFSESEVTIKLLSDYEIAHSGALDAKEGIIVVSGTGSVCFGKNGRGESARSGGWGHIIGDRGSGYGLGHDALVAVTDFLDGKGEKTALSDMISKEVGLFDQSTIISYVYQHDKSAVAALAPIVEKACSKGDDTAATIVDDNAGALVRDVAAVAKRLGLESSKVAFLGGLLENDTCFRKSFVRQLRKQLPNLVIVEKAHSASEGAAMIAMAMAGFEYGKK